MAGTFMFLLFNYIIIFTYKKGMTIMKLSQLITKLKGEITQEEWELLESKDSGVKISEHNRNTLLEMKDTEITEDKDVSTDVINDLESELKTYLDKYMEEEKKDHKWIIISSLFLTYVKFITARLEQVRGHVSTAFVILRYS